MHHGTPLVGIGAGGHAKAMLAMLLDMPQWSVVGLLDNDAAKQNTDVLGTAVLGGDHLLSSLRDRFIHHAFLGIGTPRNTQLRQRIWQTLTAQQWNMVSIIAPSAIVSRFATYGSGFACLPGAIVQAGVVAGDNVLINSGAIVEHDCSLGDHAHIASGATLAGGVIIEQGAFVGAGACLRPGIRIGKDAVVGCGAVVTRDVPAETIVVGNPAKPLLRDERSWTIQRAS